jgi:hypothetical protein
MFEPDIRYRFPGADRLRASLKKHHVALLLVLVAVGGMSISPRAQAQLPGLVAAYSFDEGSGINANDGSGNNLTGTVANATWASPGRFGSTLSFNGTNSWVTVADAASLDLSTGMTLEAWVFPTALGSGVWRNVIIKERSGGEVFNLYASADTNAPALFVVQSATGSPIPLRGTSPLPLSTWSHLAATYDNATLRLYVNGVVVASRALTGPLLTSTGDLRIGGNSLWGEFFQGSIDEVRVYNRALTQTEIQSDMSTPLGLAPPPPPSGPGLSGQWSAVMDWPLVAIHMSLLPSGEILVWDGFNSNPGSAQLWDPNSGAFTSVPNVPNIFCSGHILLPDGRVLVAGGHVDVDVGIRDTTIFNPVDQTWTNGSPMAYARWYPTVTALPDGRALVMSGNRNCATCNADIPEVYDPAADVWTRLTAARKVIPLYPFNFVLPDGRLLVAGAYHASMSTPVLNLVTQTWTTLDPTVLDAGSAVMYAPGRIMKSGSSWAAEGTSTPAAATTYVLDANQPSARWRQTAPMAFPRIWHNMTVLPDGNVLVTGGGQTADEYNVAAASLAAEMWSPATETWTTMATSQVPRFYHSVATLLPDGRVLVAGSGRAGVDQFSAEIYSPPYLFKGARPAIGSAPPVVQYGGNFTVQTPDASRIARVSLISLGSVTHAFDENQRFVPLTFQAAGGALTVQGPANGNVAPPGYYMLFLVDTAGVPSTSAMVRLPTPAEDSQPPTVAITSPADGSSVSGAITVTATASDNNNVAGVQFQVDHVNVGAEDTTSPYSFTWNTASVPNGTHTLSAVARDTAGNIAVSADAVVVVANATTGLVAAYGFNEGGGTSVADASGNGHTGAITGAAWTTQGRFGSALTFDGTSNLVTVNATALLNLTTGMTLEAWVFPTALGTSWRNVIIKERASGEVYNLYAHTDALKPTVYVVRAAAPNNPVDAAGTAQLALNAWSHLAATYDGTTLRLFVNGAQVGSRALTGALLTSTGALRIGGNSLWGEFFQGRIDEIRIYSRALTGAEIQADMANPVSGAPPDTTPPLRSNGLPTGTLAAGTTQTSLSLTTNENATCRYAMTAGVAYASMTNTFTTTGATTHSTTVTGLTNGGNYSFFVRCQDVASNANPGDFTISFSVAQPADTTPPVRSNGLPTGTLAAGTTQTTLSLATNENATCRYATTAGVAYASMTSTFTATGGTAHSSTVTGLTNGGSYTYFVRCRDVATNVNPDDFPISFAVADPSLVAAYSFNAGSGTTVADASGHGLTGTITGATWTTQGRFGNALSFNGATAWVTVPSNALLNLTTAMTLEAWVFPIAHSPNWNNVIIKERPGGEVYNLYSNTDTGVPAAFAVRSAAPTAPVGTAGVSPLPLNAWTHLAVSYDGSMLRLYVNGTQVGSQAMTGSMVTSTGALRIGGNSIWGEYFQGQIDEIRIYNRALTQVQIQADMTKPLAP